VCKLNVYGEMIVNSVPDKYIYKVQMRKGERHGSGITKIMSGVRNGDQYWAKFDTDVEDNKSRRSLLKEEEETSPSGGGQTKRRVGKYSKRRVGKRYSRR
jgi:hypothetical protein